MPSIVDILSGPVKGLADGAAEIIGKFVADPNQKLQATEALAKLNADFQSKLLDADTAFAQAQRDSVVAEEKGESWLQRNWRPIVMLSFTAVILFTFIVVPLTHIDYKMVLPEKFWSLLEIGMGGYIMGRTVEKVVPHVTGAIAGKSDGDDS